MNHIPYELALRAGMSCSGARPTIGSRPVQRSRQSRRFGNGAAPAAAAWPAPARRVRRLRIALRG